MVDYSPSIEFYNKAKKYAKDKDYRTALSHLRNTIESIIKIRLSNIKEDKNYVTGKFSVDLNIYLSFHKTNGNWNNQINNKISSYARKIYKTSSEAHHYDEKKDKINNNFSEKYIESLHNLIIFIRLVGLNEDFKIKEKQSEDSKKKINSKYNLDDSIGVKTANIIIHKLYNEYLSNNFCGPTQETTYHHRFKTINKNFLEFAVKLNYNIMEFIDNGFGVGINIIVNHKKDASKEYKDIYHKEIIDMCVKNLNSENDFEWEVYDRIEENSAKIRTKTCFFLRLEFDKNNNRFNDQEKMLEFVSKEIINLYEVLKNKKSFKGN